MFLLASELSCGFGECINKLNLGPSERPSSEELATYRAPCTSSMLKVCLPVASKNVKHPETLFWWCGLPFEKNQTV